MTDRRFRSRTSTIRSPADQRRARRFWMWLKAAAATTAILCLLFLLFQSVGLVAVQAPTSVDALTADRTGLNNATANTAIDCRWGERTETQIRKLSGTLQTPANVVLTGSDINSTIITEGCVRVTAGTTLHGDIHAQGRVQLASNATVDGDVQASKIVQSSTATISGGTTVNETK